MSSANVRSIQALDDLRAALTTFSGNAQSALRSAMIEVQRTLEFVAERERYWRGRVTTAQAELSRAVNAFNYCRSQVVRDSEGRVYQPPCDGEAAAVRRAQEDLRQSQERLQTAHMWYQQVQQAQQTFQQQTQRMGASLSDLPKANALLSQKVNTLKSYTAMSASPGGGRFVAGGGTGGGSAGGGGASGGGAMGVGSTMGTAVAPGIGSSMPSASAWGLPHKLPDHFNRHAQAFGACSPDEYVALASKFLERARTEGLPMKVSPDGVVRVYDPATNTFGSYNPDGTTRTFFKPTSPTFWNRQPGKLQ